MDEMYYYAFCIGYDLMNDYFNNCEIPECDVVFEECKRLSKKFMKSQEYKDLNYSAYEKLEEWINKNKDKIINDYTEKILHGDLPYGAEIHHNGYICLVDEYNEDDINETIVEIYQSRKDIKEGKYLERISLKNDELEKNIKEYVKENYNPIKKEREVR